MEVSAAREGGALVVRVADEGAGLPNGFDLDSTPRLGLRIVRTLVEGELRGSLSVRPAAGSGTRAVLRVPLQQGP